MNMYKCRQIQCPPLAIFVTRSGRYCPPPLPGPLPSVCPPERGLHDCSPKVLCTCAAIQCTPAHELMRPYRLLECILQYLCVLLCQWSGSSSVIESGWLGVNSSTHIYICWHDQMGNTIVISYIPNSEVPFCRDADMKVTTVKYLCNGNPCLKHMYIYTCTTLQVCQSSSMMSTKHYYASPMRSASTLYHSPVRSASTLYNSPMRSASTVSTFYMRSTSTFSTFYMRSASTVSTFSMRSASTVSTFSTANFTLKWWYR